MSRGSLAGVVIGVALGLACANLPISNGQPPPGSNEQAPAASDVAVLAPTHQVTPLVQPPSPGARTEDEENTIAVFKAAANATVFVTQTQVVRDQWTFQAINVEAGAGTGYLWDARGHVVTNYHVVDGGSSFRVTLFDGSEWPAALVGGDPRKDIAVLKIDAPADKLVPVRLPDPGYALEVGQKTIAIGNPFGLDHTLTTGVVSALDRQIRGYGDVTIKGMIQTDASINPGNSGGPLLDSQGRLIGMNTMIYSRGGESAGIGFAVPVDTVRRVVDQIVTTGKVENVGIGVSWLPDPVARRAGVQGVAVLEVHPGSPAAKAGFRGLARTRYGIQLGDVVVSVDDTPIRSYDDLYTALDGRDPGDLVKIGRVRAGRLEVVELALAVVDE